MWPWLDRPRPSSASTALLVGLAVIAAACAPAGSGAEVATTPAVTAAVPSTAEPPAADRPPTQPVGTRATVRPVERRDHDRTAFTQGLEFHEGRLFESRGLYAADESVTLTEIDPVDGTTIRAVERDPADGDYFAEGLTVVDDRIVQLTWREGLALVYDVDTLERVGEFTYDGEGWGICAEPDRLVMSDGTSTLTFRDRDTFDVVGSVAVTLDGTPVDQLNELECVDGLVWANIWQTPTIVVIDPSSGEVVVEVDATAIATSRGRSVEAIGTDVLNGIAHDAATGTWLLTGKLWPYSYVVEFDCAEGCVTPSHYRRAPVRLAPLSA